MVRNSLITTLSILAASPLAAANRDVPPSAPAPPGGPATLYCLHVTITGNIAEPVECWTRDEWADQGVDVDREWAKNGVRTLG